MGIVVSPIMIITIKFGGLLMSQKSDSYLKDIAYELKLIRVELQKQNKSTIKNTTTKKESKYI